VSEIASAGRALDEAQIRELVEGRVAAVRAKDVNGAVAGIAPDVVSFDVVKPLRRVGSGDMKKRVEEWFASFESQIGFEIRDLTISASEDVAFSHGLHRYSGTLAGGAVIDMWVRATACYRKIDGKWMLVHEHQSVPFDGQTGAASLDLEP
jgi:ketosteroid isomerase-like protein